MAEKRVHAAIAPAADLAVEQSKGDIVIDEQGQPEAPPTTGELLIMFRQFVGVVTPLMQQLQAVNDLQALALQTLQQQQAQTVSLLQSVIGGPAVAQSMQQLYTLLQQNIASDQTTAADLLAQIQQKANASTVQGLSNRLGSVETALPTLATTTALAQGLAAKLNLSGGTMTGALNVLTPTAAPNPLQMSQLPLSMSVVKTLPLLAIGGTWSSTVNVPGATVGQVVLLNPTSTALLTSLTTYSAIVTAADTVTIYLKAGLAVAAGDQTFILRVFR